MSSSPREDLPVTIAIRTPSSSYRICKLIPSKTDPSIFLHLYKDRSLHPDAIGTAEFELGAPILALIDYAAASVSMQPIDHASIHASGSQHFKLLDNSYTGHGQGLPLTSLADARPLWTIVPGRFDPSMKITTEKGRIHGLTPGTETPAVALSITAIPKGTFGSLTIPFDIDELGAQIPPPLYAESSPFIFFDLLLLWYSTAQFTAPPPVTHVIPAISNLAPFVRLVDDRHMELVLRAISRNKADVGGA